MMVDINKINTKLAAIRAKDVQAITASHTYILGLGYDYTEAQLQAWLDIRINYLESFLPIVNEDEGTIYYVRNNIYDGLSTASKLIADKILNNEDFTGDITENNFDDLVGIMLLKFITTE